MPASPALPSAIADLAGTLADRPGVEAIVLGGSRATGTHRPDSDWDLGLYYRGSEQAFDPATLRDLGQDGYVSELGEWGPIIDGGGWLTVGDAAVDVIFRDLDRVEQWTEDARAGRFEVLRQNGYLVGAPTYLPVGELAICQPIAGEPLPRPSFPDALAEHAPDWWTGTASVSLMFAGTYARTGEAAACSGMLVHAALCAAHARMAQRGEWVLNEKRLLQRAGLEHVSELLPAASDAGNLAAAVAAVVKALGVRPLAAR